MRMAHLAGTFCSAGPANWLNYSRVMPRRSDSFVQEALTRLIGLHPLAIDNHLRDSSFASAPDNFFRRARGALNINFPVADVVFLKEALGFAAV
jgi:hypothetical protein